MPIAAHPALVGANAAEHQAEARPDEAPEQSNTAEQHREAEIIEYVVLSRSMQAEEVAALVDGQAVVAAVIFEPDAT